MKTYWQTLLMMIGILSLITFSGIAQQNTYSDFNSLTGRAQKLAKDYASLTKLESIGKTTGGKDIWVLTIGKGKTEEKPAMAVVGGVYGPHLIGSELVLGFAEKLLAGASSDSISQLLETTTFYLFPNMTPDASEQYFSSLKYERTGNATASDEDRDGRLDEDPFEDLNQDGWITQIRVKAEDGSWKMAEGDERIMVKIQADEAVRGNYHVFTEGIDNDKDKAFNEDGAGGIQFNKNMAYQHPLFTPQAGEYPVSEPEVKAILDFLYDKWNVFAVFTFGPSDNLLAPMKYNAAATQGIITSPLEGDAKTNEMVAKYYQKVLGKNAKAEKATLHNGGFMEWGYFHYGRLSFSTPGWILPKWELAKDTTDKNAGKSASKKEDKSVTFLKWAEQEGLENIFVPWKAISHPDFPNQTVEVGGLAPFVQLNPPYERVDSLVNRHAEFITELASWHPHLQLIEPKITELGKGIYRVTAKVHNKGVLPVYTELGKRNQWVRWAHAGIQVGSGQTLLTQTKTYPIKDLGGNAAIEISWLVKGKGKVNISVKSAHAGSDTVSLDLK